MNDKCPGCGGPLDKDSTVFNERPTYACKSYYTPNDPPEFCESWTCLRNQLAAAQASVDKLPKDRGGFPLCPGDVISHVMPNGRVEYTLMPGCIGNAAPITFPSGTYVCCDCYSAREAAEAAKENAQ